MPGRDSGKRGRDLVALKAQKMHRAFSPRRRTAICGNLQTQWARRDGGGGGGSGGRNVGVLAIDFF